MKHNTWLNFGTEVKSIEDVKLGMAATILPGDGKPDGEYMMADGSTWVFMAGELVSMGALAKSGIIQFYSRGWPERGCPKVKKIG